MPANIQRRWRERLPQAGFRLGLGSVVAIGLASLIVVAGVISHTHPCCSGGGSKRMRAQLEADVIAAAIEEYSSRHSTVQPLAPVTVGALVAAGPNGEPPPLDPDRLTNGRLLDPWGHEYELRKTGRRSFEVISYGADGMPGGDRDDADVSAGGRL
jgi:Type II secretion system (T2SS), protein G